MSDKLPPKILVVDSNETECTSISNIVERSFFDVEKLHDLSQIIKVAYSVMPNAVIINCTTIFFDVSALVKEIRSMMRLLKLPIVFIIEKEADLLAIKQIDDQLINLISKPFTPNQLMMGIKFLLRKSQPVFQEKIIRYKDVSMDLATYTVYRGTKSIHLGPTEFKILQLFLKSPSAIFSRQQIIDYVWGIDKLIELRTVDVHVNRLRSMLKLNKTELPLIKTVRSSGYCLNLPGEIS